MRGDQQVIEYLNKVPSSRTSQRSINTGCTIGLLDNWGYRGFAKKWRIESIEEMQHAAQAGCAHSVPRRSAPNMQSLDPLRIVEKT